MNSEQDWKKQEREGKMKKSLRSKLSLLGKRVKRMGEEGTIVISSFKGQVPEYFIMFKEDDLEQLEGTPFKVWNDEKWEFLEDGVDVFFELTEEEKEFLNLIEGVVSKI